MNNEYRTMNNELIRDKSLLFQTLSYFLFLLKLQLVRILGPKVYPLLMLLYYVHNELIIKLYYLLHSRLKS